MRLNRAQVITIYSLFILLIIICLILYVKAVDFFDFDSWVIKYTFEWDKGLPYLLGIIFLSAGLSLYHFGLRGPDPVKKQYTKVPPKV